MNDTMLDELQMKLHCCGDGWDAKPREGMTCTAEELKTNEGCVHAEYDQLQDNWYMMQIMLAVVVGVILAMQTISMRCTCRLIRAVGKEDRDSKDDEQQNADDERLLITE